MKTLEGCRRACNRFTNDSNNRKYVFSNKVANNWNDLPEWVFEVESVAKFQSKLDKEWKGQEQKLNYQHI